MADDNSDGAAVAVAPRRRMKPLLLYEEIVLGGAHTAKRFTCVDVCARFLACGATNGSVYIFARSQKKQGNTSSSSVTFRLLKMISPPSATSDRHQDPVTCLSFCPVQRYLVVGTSRGAVYAISLLDPARIGEKIEFSHPLHHGFSVSALLWDEPGARVFSGCTGGTVAQTSIRAGVSAIFGSSSTEFLLKEDTSIVQLDIHHSNATGDLLLVSSQTRVLVLNLSTDGGIVQVGTKLRQGNFGGCFFVDPDDKQVKVYSSRPGKRVWVADPASGTVSSTLRFSMSVPPTPFFHGPNVAPADDVSAKNVTLSHVSLFKYIHESMDFTPDLPQLISWAPNSSALVLLDPIGVELVEWHVDLGVIHDLKVLDASVFVVLHGDPGKIAIVRACAAIEFLELAVSNDLQKSIELAVKCNILDLSLLLNLQCKWVEHIKTTPDDAAKLAPQTLAELEALVDAAATLVQEHTRPPELDIAPPHVVFKQRRDAPAADPPPPLPPSDQSLSLKLNFLYEKPALYDSVRTATTGCDMVPSQPKRHVSISDLGTNDKVVDEAWRARHLPPPSDVTLKPATLFGEVDLETHLTNATSQLVSMLPERYFGRTSSSAATPTTAEDDEPAEFPPFDPPDNHVLQAKSSSSVQSVLKLAMAVSPSKGGERREGGDDLRLIVPETADGAADQAFDPRSGQEVVLEAIATDLFLSELQFQSKRPLAQRLCLSTDNDNQDDTPSPCSSRPRPSIWRHQNMTTAAPKRPRTASDTKQQLIERTVAKQMGVCAVSHVQIKWTLGGTMRESADLAAVAAARPVFASVQADFEQAVAAAATQLHLWPPATLTRLASCATNGHLGHGDLQRARRCLEAFVGSFDPTIDMALIQKRKQIDLIKKTQLKAVQLAGSHSHKEEEEEEEDLLPLTRNDWTLVRLLVSFYFVLLGPVYVETLSHGSMKNDEYATLCGGVIPELDVQYRLIRRDATQSSEYYSEAQVQAFLATYGNYINLDWAAMVCSVRQFPQALSDVLNLAISSSESIAADCEDLLHHVAEGIPFEFPRPSAVCVCLHLLHVLLKTTKQAAVDWCVRMYPRVSPWNVQWALFGASVDFDQTNSTYLSYLTALLQKAPASRGDASIITHWLHMHFAQHQAEDVLLAFLQYPSVYMHPDVSALCFKHERWSCLVQIVLHAVADPTTCKIGLVDLRQLVCSMLQSDGPASSLSAIFHAMMQLDNPGRPLQYILEEVEAYMQQDTALDGVSKDNRVYVGILHALFDACGPQLGLRLLDTCPTLIKLAPRQLYAAVVHMQALQHAHAEQVTHILEDIDTYIWSCSRSHHMGLAPQVEATFRLECGYYDLEKKNPPLPTTTTSSDTRVGMQDDSNLVRQYFESRSNDWGGEIQLQDWHCVHCDLPVVYFGADGRNLDAVLLPCGHAFHDGCVPDRTCSICLQDNFRFG